ncbi:MAG TPA: hypothetical protein VF791_04215 [Pyrinomonadaceae bacterium]
MSIRSKVENLEEWAEQRRQRAAMPVDTLTDEELESIICNDLGISPEALTDDLLRSVSL